MDVGHPFHQLFLEREWAVFGPIVMLIVVGTGILSFLGLLMVDRSTHNAKTYHRSSKSSSEHSSSVGIADITMNYGNITSQHVFPQDVDDAALFHVLKDETSLLHRNRWSRFYKRN